MRRGVVVVIGGLAILAGPSLLHHHLPAKSLPPQKPVPIAKPAGDGLEMLIAADAWHQCYAEGWLRGPSGQEKRYRFLLDSGAGDKLVINRDQAGQLGFDVAALPFDQQRDTANGIGKAAKIELPEFGLSGPAGSYRVNDVEATVAYNGMSRPLIGAGILTALNFHLGENGCSLTLPRTARNMDRLIVIEKTR